MASIVEELIQVLDDTADLYDELLSIVQNKKNIIVKRDMEELQKVTDEEQIIAGHLLRLERERQRIVRVVCDVTNQNPKQMTISKLIELLKDKGNDWKMLKKSSSRLLRVISAVKKHNDLNKELLKQSLEYIDYTMNAIQSISDMQITNQYGQKGNFDDKTYQRNFFDAKQ